MKFDLVLQKLQTILLVQEIREPNHADQVIGHLVFLSGHLRQVPLWGYKADILPASAVPASPSIPSVPGTRPCS